MGFGSGMPVSKVTELNMPSYLNAHLFTIVTIGKLETPPEYKYTALFTLLQTPSLAGILPVGYALVSGSPLSTWHWR